MKIKLTLQKKLHDLREERKLTLAHVYKATGIPSSTMQRFENDENAHVGYQDVKVLTHFYDVSADYIFGLTENRQHRSTETDKLNLLDEALVVLAGGKRNNQLLSELIVHPDFPDPLAGWRFTSTARFPMPYRLSTRAIRPPSITPNTFPYRPKSATST